MKFNLPDVRLAFGQGIFVANGVGDGEKAFNCRFIIDPKRHAKLVKDLDKAMLDVAVEKWGKDGQKVFDKLVKDKRVLLLKEDYCNAKTGDAYDGFEDMFSIGARSAVAPLVIDRNKAPLTKDSGRPYSGCYVNAQIEIWAQDNGYGRRINAQLKGVQFNRDGDSFGGGAPASADDFADLSDVGDDADDGSDLA
jgi:hypothetical protein